jgi:hypothetical protein
MGGNNDYNHDNSDPFAKVKFTILAFYGAYDAEVYLDWEMTVEQKLNSHLVPEVHRVRQATSEFKDFAIVWWNDLVKSGAEPQTWDRLKLAIRSRFVPPSYKCDLCKKLQRLDQGSMSVPEYYQELQKGMLCCGVVEEDEDKMVCFCGGLNRNIHDIIDYNEYDSIQCLFQLAMLAEKELQGHQRSTIKGAAVFTPQPSTSNIGAPSSHAPAVPSTNATRASTSYTSVKMTTTPTVPNMTSSSPSTSHSSDIRCHLCQLLGYMQRECLRKRTYIATADGGYISTSDVEDDDIAVANITGDDNHHKMSEEEILGALDTDQYRTVIVQRSLSAQVDHAEKIQCHNLFHIFFIINDCHVLPIIDGGSCNNLVNSSVVKKLGL